MKLTLTKDNGGNRLTVPEVRSRATLVCVSLARICVCPGRANTLVITSARRHMPPRESERALCTSLLSQLQLRREMSQYDAHHVCKINTRRCSILVDWKLRSSAMHMCAVSGLRECILQHTPAIVYAEEAAKANVVRRPTLCLSPIMRPALAHLTDKSSQGCCLHYKAAPIALYCELQSAL